MLRISLGNDITLYKRLMTWNGTAYVDVPCAEITNLRVRFGIGTIDSATDVTYTAVGSTVQFRLESTQLRIGRYNIWITGVWGGNDVSLNIASALCVVPFNIETNAQDYVSSSAQNLGDDIFIPIPMTSAEVEALKVQLQTAITAANAVKAEYEAKLHTLNDMATETNATANKNAILTAIDAVPTKVLEKFTPISNDYIDSLFS